MTKKEAIKLLKETPIIVKEGATLVQYATALSIALECINKCIEIGSCKECKSADFFYDNPDVCFCLQHDRTMYADDTCNYFYRDWGDNE